MLSFLLCPNRWDSQSNLAMGELLLPVVLLSRSVWFGSVSRVKFLCPFSPSPHCTMLSHPPQFDSLTRFCQQTMQMHFSPSAVCVRARRRELGSGADARGQSQRERGRHRVQGPPGALQPHRAPLTCCSVLSPSAGHKVNQRPPNLFSPVYSLQQPEHSIGVTPHHNGFFQCQFFQCFLASPCLGLLEPRKALGSLPSCL